MRDRIHLRVSADLKRRLELSAEVERRSLTGFILSAAQDRADVVLLDKESQMVGGDRALEALTGFILSGDRIRRLILESEEPQMVGGFISDASAGSGSDEL